MPKPQRDVTANVPRIMAARAERAAAVSVAARKAEEREPRDFNGQGFNFKQAQRGPNRSLKRAP